ncbi:MAG: hypothetical protein J6X50_03000, partial [Bacilli bacterium]|nr:hypothetical protein [Bacilli bacterium]
MKKYHSLLVLFFASFLSIVSCSTTKEIHEGSKIPNTSQSEYLYNKDATLSFSFDDVSHSDTKDNVSGKNYHIDYVFNEDNESILFKKPNDPLLKQGVNNKSLYMDGFS